MKKQRIMKKEIMKIININSKQKEDNDKIWQ